MARSGSGGVGRRVPAASSDGPDVHVRERVQEILLFTSTTGTGTSSGTAARSQVPRHRHSYDAGRSRAAASGHYPPDLSRFILQALSLTWPPPTGVEAGGRGGAEATSTPLADGAGGCAATESLLGSRVREAVEDARIRPAGFSSLRYLRQAEADELLRSPLRYPMCGRWRGSWREHRRATSRRPRTAPRRITRLRSRIRLKDLVPAQRLADWAQYIAKTQEAFDAIRQGLPHRPPGDFVVTAEEMPVWARGQVWDTEDPDDCRPVERSSHRTSFPGEKQFRRDEIGRIAAELGWQAIEPDIVDQAGGGGFELRSAAPRNITAVWHHSYSSGITCNWPRGGCNYM